MTIAEQLDLAIKSKETGTTDGAYVVELGNGKKHTKKTYMTKEEWNVFEADMKANESLTPEIIRTFISKIVIHEKSAKHCKSATQQIDIYFTHIGMLHAV